VVIREKRRFSMSKTSQERYEEREKRAMDVIYYGYTFADDTRAYCKKIIDYAGKDGGFLMSPSNNIEDAKEENIRAFFDFTKEYGVY
jgi:hypothetical protein